MKAWNSKPAERLFIGPGEGASCDRCGKSIGDNALEYQFEAPLAQDGRRLRFHHECFQLWERETEQAGER